LRIIIIIQRDNKQLELHVTRSNEQISNTQRHSYLIDTY